MPQVRGVAPVPPVGAYRAFSSASGSKSFAFRIYLRVSLHAKENKTLTRRPSRQPSSAAQTAACLPSQSPSRRPSRRARPHSPPLRQAVLPLCRRPGSPPLVAHLHGPWQKAGRAYSPTVGRCGAPTRGPRPAVQRGVGGSARVECRDPRPRAETAAAYEQPEAHCALKISMPRAPKVWLTTEPQDDFARFARSRTLAPRLVQRAQIVLQAAAGKADVEIAQTLDITRQTAGFWRRRFLDRGIAGIEKDAPRCGRPRLIAASKIDEIVSMTTRQTPAHATHWSTRTLAQVTAVSPSTVGRIWRAHGLKPHRVKTFKLSNDRQFAEKLEDVVS